MLLLLHVMLATSIASEVSAGLEHSRWFTPPSGALAELTRRLDSAGTCKDLSLSYCVSLLSYYMATQDPPKNKRGNYLTFSKLGPSTVISATFYQ